MGADAFTKGQTWGFCDLHGEWTGPEHCPNGTHPAPGPGLVVVGIDGDSGTVYLGEPTQRLQRFRRGRPRAGWGRTR